MRRRREVYRVHRSENRNNGSAGDDGGPEQNRWTEKKCRVVQQGGQWSHIGYKESGEEVK